MPLAQVRDSPEMTFRDEEHRYQRWATQIRAAEIADDLRASLEQIEDVLAHRLQSPATGNGP